MKHTRYLSTLFSAILMIASLGLMFVSAQSEQSPAKTGTIVINDAQNGKTYAVYRIFDIVDAEDGEAPACYVASAKWADFVSGADIREKFLDIDANGHITWHKNSGESASVREFTEKVKAYLENNMIDNDGELTKIAGTELKFEQIAPGYYFINTELGTLCSLYDCEVNISERLSGGKASETSSYAVDDVESEYPVYAASGECSADIAAEGSAYPACTASGECSDMAAEWYSAEDSGFDHEESVHAGGEENGRKNKTILLVVLIIAIVVVLVAVSVVIAVSVQKKKKKQFVQPPENPDFSSPWGAPSDSPTEQGSVPTQYMEPPVPPPAQSLRQSFCPYCGAPADDDSSFCRKCGKSLK